MGGDQDRDAPQQNHVKHELTAANLELLNAFNLNNFFQVADEDDHHEGHNHWVYHFMDVIYVATIYNISHLMSYCGEDFDVYQIGLAYFFILFQSRTLFDTFTSIFKAGGVLHTIVFMFYGAAVFVMTLNIAFYVQSEATGPPQNTNFGNCVQDDDYNTSFAYGFLITRILLFILYGLYYFIFEVQKSHISDIASVTTSAKVQAQEKDEKAKIMRNSAFWKLIPLVLSCIVMIFIFYGYSAIYIYSIGTRNVSYCVI